MNDEVRKRNQNLPGMGGVFNTVNLHLYHYAGNNPVKYVDPTGLSDDMPDFSKSAFENLAEDFVNMVSYSVEGTKNEIDAKLNDVWEGATEWQYEGREANNTITESKDEIESGVNDWRVEPRDIFHQGDNDNIHDTKYTNPDGREVVFDGATGQKDTNSETRGTYNYVDPGSKPDKWYDIGGWIEYGVRGIGHGIADVLPYAILGNDRKNK